MRRDAEFFRRCLSSARDGIANGGDADAILDVGESKVRKRCANADAASANDAHAKGFHTAWRFTTLGWKLSVETPMGLSAWFEL